LYEITARLKQLKASFGDRHIEELDTKTMREWLDAYPVSDRTRVNIRLRASKWLNWAVEQGYLQTNPVAKIRFKVSEQEVTILSVDEVERLLGAASRRVDLRAIAVVPGISSGGSGADDVRANHGGIRARHCTKQQESTEQIRRD
jgi:site-specific recombinase XerD